MPKQGLSLLPETTVRTAKPKDKPYLLRDGGGLWLVVESSGRKWWKMRVVFAKKENSFSLGEYPSISLASARAKREGIRKQMAEGIDPGAVRKAEKVREAGEGCFEAVAREWHKRFSAKWSAGHAETILLRLEKDVFPYIGQRTIAEITPPEVLKVLRRIEERSLETAHRVKYSCGQIFRYAVSSGYATLDPVGPLRDALPPVHNKHMAAPTDPKAIAPLLRMIEGYEGSIVVKCALRLASLLFVRPGELRSMEWKDVDLDAAEWAYIIPKTGNQHIVPLSRQAVAILRELHGVTGYGPYVFPGGRSIHRCMSENAVNAALRRMGIDTRNELTGHGFRAMARTVLDEVLGFRPDLIEHQLGHSVRDPLGRAYNRTTHLPERKKMMQAWADYLDGLKAGGKIIPIRANG
jgi:integrase